MNEVAPEEGMTWWSMYTWKGRRPGGSEHMRSPQSLLLKEEYMGKRIRSAAYQSLTYQVRQA